MNYFKVGFLITLFFILLSPNSFGQDIEAQKSKFVSKILELPEFKNAVHKIDSLKEAGLSIDISFEILWEVPLELESKKEIAWGHIKQILFGSINEDLYLIKYDKLKEEIILIEKRQNVGVPSG